MTGVFAVAVGLHAASSTPAATGASFTWGPPSPSPRADSGPAVPGAPIAAPSPSPAPPASSLGGLRLPLSELFHQLNRETENTAVGQFTILHDIGDAIRDRIVGFLRWVSGGP